MYNEDYMDVVREPFLYHAKGHGLGLMKLSSCSVNMVMDQSTSAQEGNFEYKKKFSFQPKKNSTLQHKEAA